MKVLWITNILFPEAAAVLTGNDELKSSGGWMIGSASRMASRSDVELYVATVSPLVEQLTRIDGEKIVFYVLPLGKGNSKINPEYQKYWIRINNELCPDVVHIHGTESSHGHSYIKACGSSNVVISIQGMTSAYHRYYYDGMTRCDIYKNLTIRDLFKGTIFKGQRNFKRSSEYELDMIRMAKHVIGRTSWDRAKTWAINPDIQYHFCNETLRDEFYDGSLWSYDRCTPHSIFVSQASYPIKGLHQLLKAMPLILRSYPKAIVRIAGYNPTETTSISKRLKLSGYGRYLKRLIRKYNLENHTIFLGPLNAEQMKKEFLMSNVFISPSSIENSPNSLGEAQILGVPCISSYVGGAMDMMDTNTENLYRFEEIEMLAYKVCCIFQNKDKQEDMSNISKKRHCPIQNNARLFSIYQEIIENQ